MRMTPICPLQKREVISEACAGSRTLPSMRLCAFALSVSWTKSVKELTLKDGILTAAESVFWRKAAGGGHDAVPADDVVYLNAKLVEYSSHRVIYDVVNTARMVIESGNRW